MRTGRWLPAAGALAAVLALTTVPAPEAARAAAGRCGDPAQRPWCDTSLTPDQRTALLLPKMTDDEKIALLASDDPFGGPLGGFFEDAHADTNNGIERLGIPPVYMTDGPAGVRQGKATELPAPIALAGFDRDAAKLYGGTVAWEARHRGNDLVFGPTVDVLRLPDKLHSRRVFQESNRTHLTAPPSTALPSPPKAGPAQNRRLQRVHGQLHSRQRPIRRNRSSPPIRALRPRLAAAPKSHPPLCVVRDR